MSKMDLSYLSFLENEYKNREESRIEQNIFQYGPVFFLKASEVTLCEQNRKYYCICDKCDHVLYL